MKTGRRMSAVLGLLIACAASLAAQEYRTPFSAEEIDRFIADWPEVYSASLGAGVTVTGARGLNEYMDRIRPAGLDALIASLGWDAERFFDVAGDIGVALRVIEEEDLLPDIVLRLQNQRKDITIDQTLTEVDRNSLMEQIDDLITEFRDISIEYQIPASELDLVRERRAILTQLFDFLPEY